MVKASGKIEQDLKALQDKTEMMEAALDPLYEGYLKALSEAGQRQLVMAAYYLCTQAYPDKFLSLSWDERNRLQQSLQRLSAQIYEQLGKQREDAKKMSRQPQTPDGLAFLQRLLESRIAAGSLDGSLGQGRDDERLISGEASRSRKQDRSTSELFGDEEDFIPSAEEGFSDRDLEDSSSEDSDFDMRALEADSAEPAEFEPAEFETAEFETLEDPVDSEDGLESDDTDFGVDVPAADERLSIDEEEDLLAALEGLARRSMEIRGGSASSDQMDEESAEAGGEETPLTPIHLVKQQMLMERAIREVFKTISEEANDLLQKANVMPSFPRSLLAAATESGGIGEPANAVPNVVRVSVRVMHGEAMLDLDDDELPDDNRNRRSRSRRSKRSEDDRRPRNGLDRRDERARRDSRNRNSRDRDRDSMDREAVDRDAADREAANREAARRKMQRSERDSRRGRDRRSPRMIPHDVVEIAALPELAAISLRLSEIEFSDPTVSAWRSRLRQKLSELKQLGMRYKKTQRSLETAKAEDAWRSSWTVHTPESDS